MPKRKSRKASPEAGTSTETSGRLQDTRKRDVSPGTSPRRDGRHGPAHIASQITDHVRQQTFRSPELSRSQSKKKRTRSPTPQRSRAARSPVFPHGSATAVHAGSCAGPPLQASDGDTLLISLGEESTWSALSPVQETVRSKVVPTSTFGSGPGLRLRASSAPETFQTPPRSRQQVDSPFRLPRTPGYSSPRPVRQPRGNLDFTGRSPPRPLPSPSFATSQEAWDRYSDGLSEPPSEMPISDPLPWATIVDTVYHSGLVDPLTLPSTTAPLQSVLSGPAPPERRSSALPPSPLARSAMLQVMQACWGGSWEDSHVHQPPPPNAALHPSAATWVPAFRPRYHGGPGLDLKPARFSAREREWAGSQQPPVDHSWLTDIEAMSRAQMSCLSTLEWLLGILFDSQALATDAQRDSLKRFMVRELELATSFGAASISAATLGRRKAVLDKLQHRLSPTTRNWLQLQPVSLLSSLGLFGPVSSAVPELMRQTQSGTGASSRSAPSRDRPRSTPQSGGSRGPRQQSRQRPSATYTPSAAVSAPAPRERPPAEQRAPPPRRPLERDSRRRF